MLPELVWRQIGLEAERSAMFAAADGRRIERKISECRFRLPQGQCTTQVILGEASDKPLLGILTLEELGLTFNPVTQELKAQELFLLSVA